MEESSDCIKLPSITLRVISARCGTAGAVPDIPFALPPCRDRASPLLLHRRALGQFGPERANPPKYMIHQFLRLVEEIRVPIRRRAQDEFGYAGVHEFRHAGDDLLRAADGESLRRVAARDPSGRVSGSTANEGAQASEQGDGGGRQADASAATLPNADTTRTFSEIFSIAIP